LPHIVNKTLIIRNRYATHCNLNHNHWDLKYYEPKKKSGRILDYALSGKILPRSRYLLTRAEY
jgi:hypothetical protein